MGVVTLAELLADRKPGREAALALADALAAGLMHRDPGIHWRKVFSSGDPLLERVLATS